MKVKTISFSKGVKIPIPNSYGGNLSANLTLGVELDDGDRPDTAFARVKSFIDARINKEIDEIQKALNKSGNK